MTSPIVHQKCVSCEKEYVGPYSQSKNCDPCLMEGSFVIVGHLEKLPVLPDGLQYELSWCGTDEAEFEIVKEEGKE